MLTYFEHPEARIKIVCIKNMSIAIQIRNIWGGEVKKKKHITYKL